MSLVLVVDDDPVSIQLLELILDRGGYEVIEASDAARGLELVRKFRPDLVIVDDMMPEISGGEMCRRIKSDASLSHIPVILISAGMRLQDPRYVTMVGANSTLIKPTLSKDVLEAVARTLHA